MSETIDTGMLRSLLQPVVFVQLIQDVGSFEADGTVMYAGDIVAAQYWGNGKVTLTRFPDGRRLVGVAHTIKAQTVPSPATLYAGNTAEMGEL